MSLVQEVLQYCNICCFVRVSSRVDVETRVHCTVYLSTTVHTMGLSATHNVLEENNNGENEYVKYDAPTTAVRKKQACTVVCSTCFRFTWSALERRKYTKV